MVFVLIVGCKYRSSRKIPIPVSPDFQPVPQEEDSDTRPNQGELRLLSVRYTNNLQNKRIILTLFNISWQEVDVHLIFGSINSF